LNPICGAGAHHQWLAVGMISEIRAIAWT
jgi:hypothetical protein